MKILYLQGYQFVIYVIQEICWSIGITVEFPVASLFVDYSTWIRTYPGCLWTGYIPVTWKREFSLFPRMAALAENVVAGREEFAGYSTEAVVSHSKERTAVVSIIE